MNAYNVDTKLSVLHVSESMYKVEDPSIQQYIFFITLFFWLLFFTSNQLFVYIFQECIQCPEKFSSYEEHCKHIENSHFGKWKYKCGLCELIFDQKDEIKSHRAKVHTVKREPNSIKKDGAGSSAGENQDGEKSPKKKIAPKICDICG